MSTMQWHEATCYLNGEWIALSEAKIPVLDRGFIFGDGIYEVIPVDTVDGVRAPFRAREHFERMQRSLDGIRLANPMTLDQWLALMAKLIAMHPWPRQSIYVQVTRGVAKRDHAFPVGVAPTVFVTSSPWPEIPQSAIAQGVAAVTHPDERWLHCDIKSISLLGNVLAKQFAVDHDAYETVMLRDGHLTEGSSANIFIVKSGVLVAPTKSTEILPGITYDAVFDIARRHAMPFEMRPVSEAQLRDADEVWLSSSGREVMAITTLDGVKVKSGHPGPMYVNMLAHFQEAKREDAKRWMAWERAQKTSA